MGKRITTELAALALGISPAGVRQAVHKGNLRRYGTRRRALFDVDDLTEYAANHQHQSEQEAPIMSEQEQSSKFSVGDKVHMPGMPIPPVTVLEVKQCDDEDNPSEGCQLGIEIFRFKDPGTGEDDWMHSSEFERVSADRTE